MSEEMMIALISLISGGSLAALLKLVFDHLKGNRKIYAQEIDERIKAWQEMAKKNENRMEILEKKLESCERDFRALERYIILLEQELFKANLNLFKRPELERDLVSKFYEN